MGMHKKKRKKKQVKKGKSKSSLIAFILIFLIGAGILFYPTISFWMAERNYVVAHQNYQRSVAGLNTQEKKEMWEQALHYNERLVNSVIKDPFANIENIDPFDEYYQTLDVGDGGMGYIHIPKIGVLLPIYHGVSDEVLEKGVGHIPATALPVGGMGTHAVLTGHTGLNHAKMFNDLVDLKQGDEFYLEILDENLAYRVNKIEVVLPDDVSSLHREEGEDKVTLVTCTPYGVNSHRLLVTGERVPYIENSIQSRGHDKAQFPYWIVVIILLLAILVWMIGRRIRKNSLAREESRTKVSQKVPVMQTMEHIAKRELARVVREGTDAGKTQ